MTEEKKLDEKTLEDVSGGGAKEDYRGFDTFLNRNCTSCRHQKNLNCPYGFSSDAFKALGAGAICTKREAK